MKLVSCLLCDWCPCDFKDSEQGRTIFSALVGKFRSMVWPGEEIKVPAGQGRNWVLLVLLL